jgi:predicted N-acetyltransferase YhbS
MIRNAEPADLDQIAVLAQRRRERYAEYEPQFWGIAEDATNRHRPWLASLIENEEVTSLVATDEHGVVRGYLFAAIIFTPPVIDAGGETAFVDDFAVDNDELWSSLGAELLRHARRHLGGRGVAQIAVVTGHRDVAKRSALHAAGLSLASEWFVGDLRGTGYAPPTIEASS